MPSPFDHLPPHARDIAEAFLKNADLPVYGVWLQLDPESRRRVADGVAEVLVAKGLCDLASARSWVDAKASGHRFRECVDRGQEVDCWERLRRAVADGKYDEDFKHAAKPQKE